MNISKLTPMCPGVELTELDNLSKNLMKTPQVQEKRMAQQANAFHTDSKHPGGKSIAPPPFQFRSSIVQRARNVQAGKKQKNKIKRALDWASLEGPGLESTQKLQEALGINITGIYDRETVEAVMEQQKVFGMKWENGKANPAFFRRLGLIFTRDVEAAKLSDSMTSDMQHPDKNIARLLEEGISIGILVNHRKTGNKDIDDNNQIFNNNAIPWAQRHQAIGLDSNGQVAIGQPILINSTGEIIEKLHSVMMALGQNPSIKQKPKIKNLAIFAHGRPGKGGKSGGLSTNKFGSFSKGILSDDNTATDTKANMEDFVDRIRSYLKSDIRVLLFACSVGRDHGEKVNRDYWFEHARGGQNSFAAKLASELGEEASVYAHMTAGHTTNNYAAAVFGKDSKGDSGRHIFTILFPEAYIDQQLEALFPELKDKPQKQAEAKRRLTTLMFTHFKGRYEGQGKDKKTLNKAGANQTIHDPRTPGPHQSSVGAEMFTDPENASRILHEHWEKRIIKEAFFIKKLKGIRTYILGTKGKKKRKQKKK